MLSRIIVTGKNKDFPNTIRLPFGFGPDSQPATMAVSVGANQCKCKTCDGWGELRNTPVDPSARDYFTRCPDCDDGIATVVS